MLSILINAYACEPMAGSEYGVGWYVPTLLAKKYPEYKIFVLTRNRCRDKILKELNEHPINNLYFLFYDIPRWMFYKDEMKSNWGEQLNYLLWQLLCKGFIKKMHRKHHFDLIHHLTFNQYRTPSPGFFLDIPFVIGPVGGAETINPSFYQDLLEHTTKKERIRKNGNDLKIFGWWVKWKKNKKYFLFSTQENVARLSPYCNQYPIKLLPAIAFSPDDFKKDTIIKKRSQLFEMVYAGKAFDWKGIYLFLKATKCAFIDHGITNFIIKLVGIRFDEEQKLVMGWVEEQGLSNNVELIPFMERSELLKMLTTCNISVYPAFRDSGSMSVLEASVLGCPTICFNAGGQDAFPDDVLLKVPVSDSYEDNLRIFAEKLKWAYCNPQETIELGLKAKEYVYANLTWENKIEAFDKVYKELLK